MLTLPTYLGWNVDFTRPLGEPAFTQPDSVSWRVFKNPVALAIGGICAVLLEFADPRIRSGVWDHSTFKTDPAGRSRRTGMAAMIGVYGPQSAARRIIQGVTHMHTRVRGETPDGVPYRALDPELLNWVSATASYGFLTAYEQFVEPLSETDKNRFLQESWPVTRLYGVERPLTSLTEFHALLEQLMPGFEPHPINEEFLTIMKSGRTASFVPRGLHSMVVHAAVSILPASVRERLELGAEYTLTDRGARQTRALGQWANRVPIPNSPPWEAALRLGLPRSFAWKTPAAQAEILLTKAPV